MNQKPTVQFFKCLGVRDWYIYYTKLIPSPASGSVFASLILNTGAPSPSKKIDIHSTQTKRSL